MWRRCFLGVAAAVAVGGADGLPAEAVDALASIGDGARVSYLDFREAFHEEVSGAVSAPAVRAVLTACAAVGAAPRAWCRRAPATGRPASESDAPLREARPADRFAAPDARAAVARFWGGAAGDGEARTYAFVLAHHDAPFAVAREAVLSRLRLFGADAWVAIVDHSVETKMFRIRSTWSNSNEFGERDRP